MLTLSHFGRAAICLLLWSLAVAPAFAQSTAEAPAPPDPGPNLDEEARSVFEAGELAYSAGRFENALDYFERACALSQRPVLLFNIGTAAERLRHDDRAIEAFEGYLAAMPDAPNAASVRSRLEILRRSAAASTVDARAETTADAANSEATPTPLPATLLEPRHTPPTKGLRAGDPTSAC